MAWTAGRQCKYSDFGPAIMLKLSKEYSYDTYTQLQQDRGCDILFEQTTHQNNQILGGYQHNLSPFQTILKLIP